MSFYLLGFQDIDKSKVMVVGGKGANLGEISKVEGILVPDGFCVSIAAFRKVMGGSPSINELLDRLSFLKVDARCRCRAFHKHRDRYRRGRRSGCKLSLSEPSLRVPVIPFIIGLN